jgi:hypothetical protein
MDPDKRPLEDEFDRATFYRGPDPEAEEEDEYELMPPDEDLMEADRRRAREEVERAQLTVDLQQLERDERGVGEHNFDDYLQKVKFQFSTRQLLILTAVVSVILALAFVAGAFTVVLLLTFGVLAGAYGYITWLEHRQQAELEARRADLYERKRRQEGLPTPPHQ